MADICDQADLTIGHHMNAALSRLRPPPTAPWLGVCIECEDPIERERARLGFKTCIECATEIENRRKHFGAGHHGY